MKDEKNSGEKPSPELWKGPFTPYACTAPFITVRGIMYGQSGLPKKCFIESFILSSLLLAVDCTPWVLLLSKPTVEQFSTIVPFSPLEIRNLRFSLN